MGFFSFIGIIVCLYYLIVFILYAFLDSDIELFVREKIGKRISTLKGKVVWITGASSGIGKWLAIELAKNGVKLCISARRVDELEKVKTECLLKSNSQLNPSDILVLKMDMLHISSHESCFHYVLNHFGKIDVLVNNAGRSQRAEWHKIELNVDKELFELDVFSVVNLSRIYARYVERTKVEGHVVVTSSAAGLIAVPSSASYTGAKHALHGYFEPLRLEMEQMKVTIFCPGPIQTEFLAHCFTDQQGQSYGKEAVGGKKMSAERCGKLMAVAIANKTELNYVGPKLFPLIIYIILYYPSLRSLIFWALGGVKGVMKLRDPQVKVRTYGTANV